MNKSIASPGRNTLAPVGLCSVAYRYRLPHPWRHVPTRSLYLSDSHRPALPDRSPLARTEAILFLAKEPLGSRKLSRYANLADGTEARTLVSQLNHHYRMWSAPFRVEVVAGGFQLRTRPEFSPWLTRLRHIPKPVGLSTPAIETLAVVAYRQPVPRAEVEAIRGVACGEILRQLMEHDLVRVGGRSEELGRPYLYVTTKSFLLRFGLKHIDDLPRADQSIGHDVPSEEDPVAQGESQRDTVTD